MYLPSSILFACTHNAIRSPMAEGLLKRFHGDQIFVDSAGVHTGDLDHFMVDVMAEVGVDMSKHKPKVFDELKDDSFDLIVSLSPHAQHKAVEMTRHNSCDLVYWKTFDPTLVTGSRDQRLAAYREVRDDIQRKILHILPR